MHMTFDHTILVWSKVIRALGGRAWEQGYKPDTCTDHGYLLPEHPESPTNYGEGGGDDLEEEGEGDHPVGSLTRWTRHHIHIHWLHTKTGRRRRRKIGRAHV